MAEDSKKREYANVAVSDGHIHVRVFSGDSTEVESYDIERRKSGQQGVTAHFPKRMSLDELRAWMEQGCPLEIEDDSGSP